MPFQVTLVETGGVRLPEVVRGGLIIDEHRKITHSWGPSVHENLARPSVFIFGSTDGWD